MADVDLGQPRGGRTRPAVGAGATGDLGRQFRDLVGDLAHLLETIVFHREFGKRLRVARPDVLVADVVEPDDRRRRQQHGIDMDRLALRVPLANDRQFLVENEVGGHRPGGNQQDENVADAEFRLYVRPPVRAAHHLRIDPQVERSRPLADIEIFEHEAQPGKAFRTGLFGLVPVRITDEDDRLAGRHQSPPADATICASGVSQVKPALSVWRRA